MMYIYEVYFTLYLIYLSYFQWYHTNTCISYNWFRFYSQFILYITFSINGPFTHIQIYMHNVLVYICKGPRKIVSNPTRICSKQERWIPVQKWQTRPISVPSNNANYRYKGMIYSNHLQNFLSSLNVLKLLNNKLDHVSKSSCVLDITTLQQIRVCVEVREYHSTYIYLFWISNWILK